MRRARWLLLAAIVLIGAAVFRTYSVRVETIRKETPAPPAPLETGIEAQAGNWHIRRTEGGRPIVEIRAKGFRQIKEPSLTELQGVELDLFHKDGREFDRVTGARAQFDAAARTLYSEGPVEITMGLRAEGPARGRLLRIRGSGVRFESETGKAVTERAASFEFDRGGGSAVGAKYDPSARELHLLQEVALEWRGKSPKSEPIHIQAGEANYNERKSEVILGPWSKLRRGGLSIEAGMSFITIEDGVVTLAVVQSARGVQREAGRKTEFGADQLTIHFNDDTQVTKIEAEGKARLASVSRSAQTDVTARRLDLDFEASKKESVLTRAVANWSVVVESRPVAGPGSPTADTRTLRSESVTLQMRPGGEEIASVETHSPGVIDFVPNRAGQPRRHLEADHIAIAYGDDNRIESFRAVRASTRTDHAAAPGKAAPPPALTSSQDLSAKFDPESGELRELDQWNDFRYEEGPRKARSNRARLDQAANLLVLEGAARVWDPTGSAAADRITMNRGSGDFTAEGNVSSTRLPDRKGVSSAMLSSDEALQAKARKMVSSESQSRIHYEGNAVAWQGANRIQAERLDIDRDRRVLEAHGGVISQFLDKSKKAVYTVVNAPHLLYTEETRLALYTGGVLLTRPGIRVNAREIRAHLNDAGADSSLDRAFADGAVEIVQTAGKRTRTGSSDHAEYYAGDEKMVLQGGQPRLVDSLKGFTRGPKLTWWANDDRLLVDGAQSQPAQSIIRRK